MGWMNHMVYHPFIRRWVAVLIPSAAAMIRIGGQGHEQP